MKKIIKIQAIVEIEAEIDDYKGDLTNTDIVNVIADIDDAIRSYEIIYPSNRPDFTVKLIRVKNNENNL